MINANSPNPIVTMPVFLKLKLQIQKLINSNSHW